MTTLVELKNEINTLQSVIDSDLLQVKKLESAIKENQSSLAAYIQQKERVTGIIDLLSTVDRQDLEIAINEVLPSESTGTNHRSKTDDKIQYLPTWAIGVDARRFQFKIMGALNKDGIVGSLRGCQSWNDDLAGVLSVWRDENNYVWVVNGHNRLAKAKALGVDRVLCRFLDASTAKDARALGALINLAEGNGTPLDVAKFLRDTNTTPEYLESKGVNLTASLARDGIALSHLSPALFSKALDGSLPLTQGVAIGSSNLSHSHQDEVMKLLAGKKISGASLSELIDLIEFSPEYNNKGSLLDALGFEDSQNLALIKADLQASIKSQISKSKKLFDTVSKEINHDTLEGAGAAIINLDKSEENSTKLARLLLCFDINKNGDTELSNLLNEAAIAIHEGAKKSKILKDLEQNLLENPGIIAGYNPESGTTEINTDDILGEPDTIEPA